MDENEVDDFAIFLEGQLSNTTPTPPERHDGKSEIIQQHHTPAPVEFKKPLPLSSFSSSQKQTTNSPLIPPTPPSKPKTIEAIGYPYGRNKTYSLSCVCRFLITKMIKNTAYPNTILQDVPIHGLYELPTYSPFIVFHLLLELESEESKEARETGNRVFIVKKIFSCETRPITVANLERYLVKLYDCTNGKLNDAVDLKQPTSIVLTVEQTQKKKKVTFSNSNLDQKQKQTTRPPKKKHKKSDDNWLEKAMDREEEKSDALQAKVELERQKKMLNTRLKTPGEKWFKKFVKPFIKHWPKEGLTLENVDFYLNQLYQNTRRFDISNHIHTENNQPNTVQLSHDLKNITSQLDVSLFHSNKDKQKENIIVKKLSTSSPQIQQQRNTTFQTTEQSLFQCSDVYTIIYSKIKPCLRGKLFEYLLMFFHESFLYSLTVSQQLAIFYLMKEKPEIMMFWRSALLYLSFVKNPISASEISMLSNPNYKTGNGSGSLSFMQNLFDKQHASVHLISRRRNFFELKDRFVSANHLSFDPTMPMWTFQKYKMYVELTSQKKSNISLEQLSKAVEICFDVQKHLYYNANTVIPSKEYYNKHKYISQNGVGGLRNSFYDFIFNKKQDPSMSFLLKENIFVESLNKNACQPLEYFIEENKLVQTLVKVSKKLIVVDSNYVCGPLFLKEFYDRYIQPVLEDTNGDEPYNFNDDDNNNNNNNKKEQTTTTPLLKFYSCNQQMAEYQQKILSIKIESVFEHQYKTPSTVTASIKPTHVNNSNNKNNNKNKKNHTKDKKKTSKKTEGKKKKQKQSSPSTSTTTTTTPTPLTEEEPQELQQQSQAINNNNNDKQIIQVVTHLYIFMAHKIPIDMIQALLESTFVKNNYKQFKVFFCCDSDDFSNRNFEDHTFISFHSFGSDQYRSRRFSIEKWKAEFFKESSYSSTSNNTIEKAPPNSYNSIYYRDYAISIESYLNIRNETLAKHNSQNLKNLKEIISYYKMEEIEVQSLFERNLDKKESLSETTTTTTTPYLYDYENSYVILCSNNPTKKQLLDLLFSDKKKTYQDFSFLCKNYVFINQTNSRGKINQAWLVEDDKTITEVTTTQEMDVRRNEHIMCIGNRNYSSNETLIKHSTFELVSNYVGPPVRTVAFVVSQYTTKRDLENAAKYALETFKIFYTFNTSFNSLSNIISYTFSPSVLKSDFLDKLLESFRLLDK